MIFLYVCYNACVGCKTHPFYKEPVLNWIVNMKNLIAALALVVFATASFAGNPPQAPAKPVEKVAKDCECKTVVAVTMYEKKTVFVEVPTAPPVVKCCAKARFVKIFQQHRDDRKAAKAAAAVVCATCNCK